MHRRPSRFSDLIPDDSQYLRGGEDRMACGKKCGAKKATKKKTAKKK
jgi:hypothetical protein